MKLIERALDLIHEHNLRVASGAPAPPLPGMCVCVCVCVCLCVCVCVCACVSVSLCVCETSASALSYVAGNDENVVQKNKTNEEKVLNISTVNNNFLYR